MHQSIEELIEDMNKAREIIERRPDVCELPTSEILDALDDGTQEMRHYRWEIAAILYVNRITDFSYDSLVGELAVNSNPKYLCGFIMFLLQQEHGISCVRVLKYAVQKDMFPQIFPFVYDNIPYESIVNEETIDIFFSLMHRFPENKQYRLFSCFSEKIMNSLLEQYAFSQIFEKREKGANLFLPYLLDAIYKKDCNNGDAYLDKLIHSPHAVYWLNAIVTGLKCSLKKHLIAFEDCFSIIHELVEEENTWERLECVSKLIKEQRS